MLTDSTITGLLKLYDSGKLCLPTIQRGYVWKDKQVAKLIDSLYRDVPIGLFLFWEPENIKHFKDLKGSKPKIPTIAIIDGQQRLTSIHLVQTGEKSVMFDTSYPNGKFQIENKKTKADPKWISVAEVWNTKKGHSKFNREIADKLKMTSPEKKDQLNDKIDKIRAIPAILLHNHIINEENYSKITQIFRTINTSGKKLSPADAVYAVAALKFPGIVTEELEKIREKYKNWQTMVIKNDFFSNALASLCINTVKMKPFEEYLLNQKTTKAKMKVQLKKLKRGTAATYDFFQDNFGINEKNAKQLIPGRNTFVPMVNLLGQTKGRLGNKETKLLKLWLFLAIHNSQYSGKAYKWLDHDIRNIDPKDAHKTIQLWLKSIETQFGVFKITDLGSKLDQKSRFSVFFALKQNKAKDWWTGTSIENLAKTEYHHIFPQAVLEKAGYTKSEINDPRNIAVLSEFTNRMQQDEKPINYFNDRNLISDPERLFNQYVPQDDDLWKVENYKDFLEERGKLIVATLDRFVTRTKK